MDEVEKIPKKYEDAVDLLAQWHAEGRADDLEILSFPDPNKRTVRLVEISSEFPDTGDSSPIAMGPSVDFPFPSGVILLSKREWEEVQNGSLSLPEGWNQKDAQKVWPN